jgi:hypothetical protein
MKLTSKDKEFLEKLRQLTESRDLTVELRGSSPPYMVLRGTYGDKIYKTFRMTRQGVRWRFQRLFNEIYVSAFETILFIEKTFGTGLRDNAIRISKERYARHRENIQANFQSADHLVLRKGPEEK